MPPEDSIAVTERNEPLPTSAFPPPPDAKAASEPFNPEYETNPKRSVELAKIETEQKPETLLSPPSFDEPPDGGFDAWGTVVAYFVISFVSVGSLFSWSVYFRYYFQGNIFPGTSQTLYTMSGGLSNAAGCLIAPFLGTLADSRGYRVVVLCGCVVSCASYIITSFAGPTQVWMVVVFQGILNGMGSQACWMVSLAAIPGWFGKRRGFAMSLASTGAGVGGLAWSNLTQLLFDRLGHVWALRITGFITLGAIAPAALLVKTRTPPRPRTGPLLNLSSFHDTAFVLLFVGSAIINFAYALPMFFITTYGTSIGLAPQTAAFILGLQNAVTSPSRIFIGLLMDRIGALNVFLVCNVIGGVLCLALWPNARTLGSLIGFSLAFGATGAQFFSQMPIVLASVFGPKDSASRMGLVMLSLVFGAVLGNFAGGRILDSHTTPNPQSPTGYDQDFVPVMVYTGTVFLIACCFTVAMRWKLVGWRWRVKI